MTTINGGQKKAMGDILRAMNSAIGDEVYPSMVNESSISASTNPHAPDSEAAKVHAMREIMQRFNDATSAVRERAETNPVLMEALQTEKTESGVRISEWEIVLKESGEGKFYDVVHGEIVIASDLRLYEAALLLTQELNKGKSITSSKVKQILRLEEDFSKNLSDAVHYARMAKKTSGDKAIIAEARYSDARAKAISAKEEIKRIR